MQKSANKDIMLQLNDWKLGSYLIQKRCKDPISTLYMQEVAFLWLRNSEGVPGT